MTVTESSAAAPDHEGPVVIGLAPEELPIPDAPKQRKSLVREYGPPGITFVAFLTVWCIVHRFVLASYRRFLLPYPWDIVARGFTQKDNPKNPRSLINALLSTARTSIGGMIVAVILGIALAVIMSRRVSAEKAVYPYAVALQATPILALVPLIRLLFGSGYMARTIVCVIIAIFPIMVNTLFGLKSPDQGMHDLFTLHGANSLTRLMKLQFPAALPAMFEGFRISAGLSVIGAIVGEFYMRQGPRGLGVVIDLYYGRLWYEQMYAAITMTALYGLTVFATFGVIRNKVIGRWYNTKR